MRCYFQKSEILNQCNKGFTYIWTISKSEVFTTVNITHTEDSSLLGCYTMSTGLCVTSPKTYSATPL